MTGTPCSAVRLDICTRYTEMGASSRLRYYLYRQELERAGFQPVFHPLLDETYLSRLYAGRGKSKFALFSALVGRFFELFSYRNTLLVEYELFPFIPASIELALIGKRKYILNFDDFVWEKYKNIPFLRDKYDQLIRRASGVIAANHLLYDRIKPLNSNVILIPTVVDLDKYDIPAERPAEKKILKVAWIGTPVTYQECFLPFAETFRKICSLYPLEFLLIAGKDLPVPEGINAVCAEWSAENEAQLLSTCDFGIMPLADDDFSRGKSAYKLIQYAASGLPAVASPVGENCFFIDNGKNGFTAAGTGEWVEAVGKLFQPELRRSMSENMRKKAFDYSLQKYAPLLADFLRSCI